MFWATAVLPPFWCRKGERPLELVVVTTPSSTGKGRPRPPGEATEGNWQGVALALSLSLSLSFSPCVSVVEAAGYCQGKGGRQGSLLVMVGL